MSENPLSAIEAAWPDPSLSLGPTLHDARLERITSSQNDQTLTFRVDIPHLRKFHQLPAETRFEIRCLQALWARIGKDVPWPGTPFGVPEDGKQESAPDWASDWQGNPCSWRQFEQRLTESPWGPPWIFEAWLDQIPDAQIPIAQTPPAPTAEKRQMLRLGLEVDEDFWPGLAICFSQLEITDQEGRAWSLREFLDLGIDYLEDFAERSQAVREASIPR